MNHAPTDPKSRRPSKPMTQARLERACYHYLERYATSRANLKRVLDSKVRRGNEAHGAPTPEQQRWIDALVDKIERLGLVDDLAYAAAKARGLKARGKPARAIRHWLKARGLSDGDIEKALAELAEDAGGQRQADTQAAIAYARRRRFGPFRRAPADRNRRNKEIAAFARAGFAYGLATAVVDAADEEGLATLLAESGDRDLVEDFA